MQSTSPVRQHCQQSRLVTTANQAQSHQQEMQKQFQGMEGWSARLAMSGSCLYTHNASLFECTWCMLDKPVLSQAPLTSSSSSSAALVVMTVSTVVTAMSPSPSPPSKPLITARSSTNTHTHTGKLGQRGDARHTLRTDSYDSLTTAAVGW